MQSSSNVLQPFAIPFFKLQKLISAQTLESETKLHPKTSEPRGYAYSLIWALQVRTFYHLSSAILQGVASGWWQEMSGKSTMKSSLMMDKA
jgi:hypothetical protein